MSINNYHNYQISYLGKKIKRDEIIFCSIIFAIARVIDMWQIKFSSFSVPSKQNFTFMLKY